MPLPRKELKSKKHPVDLRVRASWAQHADYMGTARELDSRA
jgi:hypothetical protein